MRVHRVAAAVLGAVLAGLLTSAGVTTAPAAHAEASGTTQLRVVVINGIGEIAKDLREIEARKKTVPTSDWDVRELQFLYLGPLATKNDVVPKIRRAGGHQGLQRAAVRFFSQMACWGLHSSRMIGWAARANGAAAGRESNSAKRCLGRARVVQTEVSRLLRATA
jgi:hypothetical protein